MPLLQISARSSSFQSTHPVRGATHRNVEFLCQRLISIHAPRAGCDVLILRCSARRWGHFNPRTPCGVRPTAAGTITINAQFQSTHPVRGATALICSPPSSMYDFNPRTPCGVRPSRLSCPRRSRRISIHAPRAGCDCQLRTAAARQLHFNPRTPCGVRRFCTAERHNEKRFQSTHPVRGAT